MENFLLLLFFYWDGAVPGGDFWDSFGIRNVAELLRSPQGNGKNLPINKFIPLGAFIRDKTKTPEGLGTFPKRKIPWLLLGQRSHKKIKIKRIQEISYNGQEENPGVLKGKKN